MALAQFGQSLKSSLALNNPWGLKDPQQRHLTQSIDTTVIHNESAARFAHCLYTGPCSFNYPHPALLGYYSEKKSSAECCMFRVRWWWCSFGISAALGQQKMCFCCFRNGPGHKGCSMFYHSSKLLWHLSSIILQIFGQQLNIITKLIRCLVRNMSTAIIIFHCVLK